MAQMPDGLTPQQRAHWELIMGLNRGQQGKLSYQEWLQATGRGRPAQAPQQPAQGSSDPTQLAMSLLSGGSGGAAAESLAGGGTGAAADVLSGLASPTMPAMGPTVAGQAPSVLSTGAAAPAAESTLGLSGMGAGPMALGALGAGVYLNNIYEGGGKDIIRGKGKRDDYTNLLLDVNPVTAPINMGLRALGMRSVGRQMKTGKSDDQLSRDAGRSAAQQAGFADDKYMSTLADGSTFNIGLDGKTSYKNVGQNIDGRTERHAYDVDFSNPVAKALIPRVDTEVRRILGPNASAKQVSDLTGQLINAATSNANDDKSANANLDSIFSGGKLKTSVPPPEGSGRINSIGPVSKGPLMIPKGAAPISGGAGAPGHWEDSQGNKVGGIDPGFTMGNRFVPDVPTVQIPKRSSTRSSGIGLDGKLIPQKKR